MIKGITYFIFFVFIVSNILAQQANKAEVILEKLSSKTKSYNTIKVDFTFTNNDYRGDVKNTSHGTLFLKKNKYKLELMDNNIFFDGKTLWNYLVDVNEVNISEPDTEEGLFFENPGNLFSFYEKGFSYILIYEYERESKLFAEIDLLPIEANDEYTRIKLTINKTNTRLHSIEYFDVDNNSYLVQIKNFITDTEMKDSMFRFSEKDHPGVEVVDLRW